MGGATTLHRLGRAVQPNLGTAIALPEVDGQRDEATALALSCHCPAPWGKVYLTMPYNKGKLRTDPKRHEEARSPTLSFS